MSILPLRAGGDVGNIDIMRKEQYCLKDVGAYLRRRKIATIDQMRRALGNPKERTVFRKLDMLDYLSSYSHRGMYYTLRGIAEFDAQGLWSHRAVWFSQFGNLRETTRSFVEHSAAGYTARELGEALHVEVRHCLVQLFREDQLFREVLHGSYVYLSCEAKTQRMQRKRREQRQRKPLATVVVANPKLAEDEAKAVVLLFVSALDERQRRLYAGLESLKLGHGGDTHIAELFGMDPHTVARGRQELEEGDWDPEHLRSVGGGRLPVEKKRRKS